MSNDIVLERIADNLNRIADTLEDLRSDVTFSPPEPPTFVPAECRDCDELWQLARNWERYATDNPHAEVELRAFVRGRRP